MKALITYFSQTDNTKTVGQAICEEIKKGAEVDFKSLGSVEDKPIEGYDLFILGTPIHSGGLPPRVADFLASLNDAPGFRMAAFVTHMSTVYQKENFERGLAHLQQAALDKNIPFLGTFDCQGKLADNLQAMVQETRNIPKDTWQALMDETNKHPDAADLANARAFAQGILAK